MAVHKCTECLLTFRRPSKLKAHFRIHTGERPFACSCGKAYARFQHLRRHQVSCSHFLNPSILCLNGNANCESTVLPPPKKNYFCPDCKAGPFRQKKMVWAHVAIVHRERRHACSQCSKAFPTKSKLTRHSAKHHGFICSKCVSTSSDTIDPTSKTEPLPMFDTFVALRRHTAIFHPKPSLQCSICDRRFDRPSALSEHERTHTPGGLVSRRQFICPFCPDALSVANSSPQAVGSDNLLSGAIAFTVKRNLHAHLRSVHANLAFPCSWPGCPVLLSSNQKLSEHLQRHRTNRPVAHTTRNRHRKQRRSKESEVQTQVSNKRHSSKHVDEDCETASQSSVVALLLDSGEDLPAQ